LPGSINAVPMPCATIQDKLRRDQERLMDSEPIRDPKRIPSIKVNIRHGDLAYVRHPVLAGHYRGDVIIRAEQELDQRLGGALSRRSSLGLYPGRHGTQAVFFSDDKWDKPSGAIVVGLGQVGGLTPVLLQSGVRDALLEFALQVLKWPDDRFNTKIKTASGDTVDGPRSAAVSCLLVGSGTGGVTVGDSVESILWAAVRANKQLQLNKLSDQVVIDHIEFIDLYEDVALTAGDALERLLEDKESAEGNGKAAGEEEKLSDKVEWKPRVVNEGEGRLYRLRSTEPEGWWHPLEIIEERIDKKWLGLKFIASTEGARAEVTQAVGQLRLAESFIADASNTWVSNAEAGKTLYEMLLPNRLKEMAPHRGNLVLLVDEVSARYPWEALEDRWDVNGQPVVIARGAVRQLKTPQFRPHPAYALSNKAFVVGNPKLKWDLFKDLPGAEKEAKVVADLLGAGESERPKYEVTACIGKQAKDIVEGLHKKPWRILHLAGHGEHEFPIEKDKVYPASDEAAEPEGDDDRKPGQKVQLVSGMVIGKGIFLTPGDVEQMRWTPELVFINCCYLGDPGSDRPRRYNELAANLGVQFINMGVTAVIAAGWVVHDDASHVFAQTFYERMLDGETFGEAVRCARRQIWKQFPDANTWSAYQCYGDPGFRLYGEGGEPITAKPVDYHSPCELIADLENLAEQVRVQSSDDGRARKSLQTFMARIPAEKREDWPKRADVAAAIGLAWGEIGEWAEAIPPLEAAIAAEKSNCSLRVIEQCANFEVRLAVKQWFEIRAKAPADVDGQRVKHIQTVERAIRKLKILSRCAETEERLSLIGGSYKRLALIQTEPSSLQRALQEMANNYEKAYLKQHKPYAFTNWATALMLVDPVAAKEKDFETVAVTLREALNKQLEDEHNFWNFAGIADIDLVRLMAACLTDDASQSKGGKAGKAAKPAAPAVLNTRAAELKQDVIDSYRRAFKRGASPREKGSVIENLSFVIEMIDTRCDALVEAVKAIKGSLVPITAEVSRLENATPVL
jgi:hypothetical protein